MTSTRLVDLPEDALAIICDLVDGCDITSLLLCGNLSVLISKINSAAQKVRCERFGCSRFPFTLFTLPKLRELDISIIKPHFGDYPLRLEGALPLPKAPMPTLTVLRLSFAQSFSICDSNLRLIFPQLTELRLLNDRRAWNAACLRNLPLTLRKLSLCPSYSFKRISVGLLRRDPYLAHITTSDLSQLPSCLEELVLSVLTLTSSSTNPSWPSTEPSTCWDNFAWPPGLRKLHFSGVFTSKEFFDHLPPQVEDLDLYYDEADDIGMQAHLDVPVSKFPRTLKRLKVHTDNVQLGPFVRIELDGGATPLPPNIEYWNAITDWTSIAQGKGKEEQKYALKAYLPSSLRELLHPHISGRNFMRHQYLYSMLPLTSLTLWRVSSSDIAYHLLPRTLRSLTCALDSSDQAFALPSSSLTHLNILHQHKPLPSEVWSHLASFLNSLAVGASEMRNAEEFLEALSSLVSSPLTQLDIALRVADITSCNDLGILLPRQLEALTLTIPDHPQAAAFVNRAVSQMALRLHHLERFFLAYMFGIDSCDEQAHMDIIPHLPNSIKILTIITSMEDTTFSIDPSLSWPQKLISLSMDRSIALSEEHIQRLPKSITNLSIGSVQGLDDSKLWRAIPPTVHTAEIPFQKSDHSWYYKNNPIWEGWTPIIP